MEISPQRITNKIKQALGGNWGHPSKFEKQKVKIPNPMYPEEPRVKSVKKKHKRVPRPYAGFCCPFCGIELPIDQVKAQEDEKMYGHSVLRWYSGYRVTTCPDCGAYKVPECPACKRSIWFEPKSQIYKHQAPLGCGFVGKRKNGM